MTGRNKRVLLVAGLVAIAMATSGCELSLPVVDCSWIDQPDMGGLVCAGLNVLAIGIGAIAFIVALLLALGGVPT